MKILCDCYEQLARIAGASIEQLVVVEKVEQYRQFWKPKKIRLILLAESHVYTGVDELNARMTGNFPLEGYPREFVRFVYCIGYSENRLLECRIENNSGTPQYWKIFLSCTRAVSSPTDFTPILRRNAFEERISEKISILKALRDRGVWLLDSSIGAIYQRRGFRANPKVAERMILSCWENYVRETISNSQPSFVRIVGKGVGTILRGRMQNLMGDRFDIVEQPQARLSSHEHFEILQGYSKLCAKYCQPNESIT